MYVYMHELKEIWLSIYTFYIYTYVVSNIETGRLQACIMPVACEKFKNLSSYIIYVAIYVTGSAKTSLVRTRN